MNVKLNKVSIVALNIILQKLILKIVENYVYPLFNKCIKNDCCDTIIINCNIGSMFIVLFCLACIYLMIKKNNYISCIKDRIMRKICRYYKNCHINCSSSSSDCSSSFSCSEQNTFVCDYSVCETGCNIESESCTIYENECENECETD